jgi:hypothetical protein
MTPKIKEHVGRASNDAVSGHRRRAERRLRLSRGQMPRLRYAPDCRPRHCPLTQNHTCARTGTLYALQRMLGGAAVCVQAQSVDRAAIQQARLRAPHRKCGRTIGLVSCGLKVIKHLLLLRRSSSQFFEKYRASRSKTVAVAGRAARSDRCRHHCRCGGVLVAYRPRLAVARADACRCQGSEPGVYAQQLPRKVRDPAQ